MSPSNLHRLESEDRSASPQAIKSLIHKFTRGGVSDGQMTSWLKEVYRYGMTDEETIALVDAMITSGDRMDFSHLSKFVADKHSTGGVGDKVSLILGPLMASAGLAIPMITGRSLGHTGGTLDKLESIPGYKTNLSLREFQKIVENVGISMVGQTDDICPADKKMYALRDATDTIKSVPLICGSIMSKKIAEGIQGLVLNITVGNGAFMKTVEEAQMLGEKLVMVGKHFDLSADVVYSDMNQPLGHEAGLWNEMMEVVRSLHGKGPDDLMEVVFELGASLLLQSRMTDSTVKARKIQESLVESGAGYQKLIEMVEAQGGDPTFLDDPEKHPHPPFASEILARSDGYVSGFNTRKIGVVANRLTVMKMGGKRKLDPMGGVTIKKKVADAITAGDVLAICFGTDRERVNQAARELPSAITISQKPVRGHSLFY